MARADAVVGAGATDGVDAAKSAHSTDGVNDPVSSPSRLLTFFCLVLVLWGSWAWNHDFSMALDARVLSEKNDVLDIWRGYEATPRLWPESLRWWHGPWIEQGVHVFRPLASYLLWVETAIGRQFGFVWVGWIGVALLAWLSWLCVCLAWTFTRHPLSALLAAVLAPFARSWLMGGMVPSDWLAWYPVHHDLLMTGLLLCALLYWTRWLETARRRDLVWCWLAFVAGVLCKEFVYIFPLMAATLAGMFLRRRASARAATTQCAFLFASVALFWWYRQSVLPGAYNPPPLKRVHFLRRPFLYWFPAFYRYLLTESFFSPILSAWLFASVGVCARTRAWRAAQRPAALWRWLPALFVFIGIYGCCALFSEVTVAFWYFFDSAQFPLRLSDLLQMVLSLWFVWMIFKYRRQEPTLAVLGVMMLAYLPVWTYLGWHYTIAGWFVRAGLWWPLLLKLALRDIGGTRWLHFGGRLFGAERPNVFAAGKPKAEPT